MGIISGIGVFSGIDSAKIIDQLLAVERKPIDNLNNKKNDYNAQISKWGNISSLLNGLKTSLTNLKSTNLLPLSAKSSDPSVLTATAGNGAAEGTYSIKVLRLADNQSLYSQAFSSPSDEVANLNISPVQKLMIKVGESEEKVITITDENNSLSGLRDAINALGLNVRANIVNDGSGYRLIISSTVTGAQNKLVIKVDEDNDGIFENSPSETDSEGLSRFAFNPLYDSDGNVIGGVGNLSQAKKASDAVIDLDGLVVTRPKNQISDLLPNVTINLLKLFSENVVKLTVERDFSSATKNVNNFVTNYNNLINALKDKDLKDDAISRQIMSSLRNILISSYDNKTITNFGLNHDKNGVLSLDSNKFESLLKERLSDIVFLLDTVAKNMEGNINVYLDKIIPTRNDTLKRQISFIDKRIELLEERLSKMELDYRRKFYELEKTIGALQKSGDYVTQTLSKWGNNK